MAQESPTNASERGIRFWMEQVVAEAEKARDSFAADPVHDLRVAIRRCRSMAEGFGTLDSDSTWKKMRRAAKPVFSALGDLRDVQVQMEWVEKLGGENDPVRAKFMEHFQQREHELKAIAEKELAAFDIAQWQQWTATLDERAQLLPLGGAVFQVMALERWRNARQLQSIALRNRSKVAMHSLRIGIKKFRYIVENFLPDLYDEWSKDLKKLQDALGEVHDLDVLADTARAIHIYENPQQRQHWTSVIQRERKQRIDLYRSKMLGKTNLWQQWRSQLPQGEALHASVLKTFEIWSQFRDPDVAHTRRVLASSLAIFDRLEPSAPVYQGVSYRDLLSVAILAHEVGRGQHNHHKKTAALLSKIDAPPGWEPIHLLLAGTIARYHRGALPRESQASYASLAPDLKPIVNLLGGIIRLADAIDHGRNGSKTKIKVSKSNCALTIQASGYDDRSPAAERIAAARHLLEITIRLPIMLCGS